MPVVAASLKPLHTVPVAVCKFPADGNAVAIPADLLDRIVGSQIRIALVILSFDRQDRNVFVQDEDVLHALRLAQGIQVFSELVQALIEEAG